MTIQKRLFVSILCLSIVLVPLLSFAYLEGNMKHECTGVDCHICIQIEAAIQNVNNYNTFYIPNFLVLAVVLATTFICPLKDIICLSCRTLISLKVELLI